MNRKGREERELKACRHALAALRPRYTPGGFLGRGSFGVVYEIFDSEEDNKPYAVKLIAPHSDLDFFVNDDALRELRNTLSVPETPYVIAFREVVILSNFMVLFIMTRYDCTLCSVFKYERLNAACVRSLFYQLVAGLAVLHGADICHRDLKPANIFMDLETGAVVIGDLGVARHRLADYVEGGGRLTGEVATCGYAPIETLLPIGRYTSSMDMWSLGVILCEAIIGRPPFPQCVDRAAHVKVVLGMHGVSARCVGPCPHCNPEDESDAVASGCTRWFLEEVCMQVISAAALPSRVHEMLHAEKTINDEVRDLVAGMLRYVPDQRLDIAAVANAPYVATFVDEPGTREMTALKRLLYHTHTAMRTPAHTDTTSTTRVRVLAAFCIGSGTVTGKKMVLTPTSRLTWPINGDAQRNILMHLLTAFLREDGHRQWCLEAWLMALTTASILSPGPLYGSSKIEGVERLAAYITYGLACATPSALDEPYNRFQWLDDLPGTIDAVHVARQEAYITCELGKHGLVPLANMALLQRAKRTLGVYSEIREFCIRTVRGGDDIRNEDELLLFL